MRRLERGSRAVVLAQCVSIAACFTPTEPADTEHGVLDNGSVRLSYVLDVPTGAPPFPAVVLGHGSGPVTAADLDVVARPLVDLGLVVLRFDKRGVGASSGRYVDVGVDNSESALDELATDLDAALRFLSTRPDVVDGVGLYAVSQSGWLVPLVAARDPDLAFAIVQGGNAVPVGLQVRFQSLSRLLDDRQIRDSLAAFRGPWGFDPLPDLTAMDVPTLWLYGGLDRLTPTAANVALLQRLRSRGTGPRLDVVVYPAGSHALIGIDHWRDVEAWLRDVVRP